MATICKKCGATISDTANFCTECGAKIEKEEKSIAQRVCPNCGVTVSDTANFCTKCGTKIEQTKAYEGNDMFNETIHNLRGTVIEFLQKQRENPQEAFSISFDFDKMEDLIECENEEDLIMTEIAGSIANCCFLPDNGNEVFSGTLNDGKAHLMLEYRIDETETYSARVLPAFLASSVSNKFTYLKSDFKNRASIHHFYADFGDEVDEIMNACETLIMDLLGSNLKHIYYFEVSQLDSKDAVYRQAVKTARFQTKELGLITNRIK